MPLIYWHDGYVGGARPRRDGLVEDKVSKKPAARRAVRDKAEDVGRKARTLLEASGRSGQNRTWIEVRHAGAMRMGNVATLDSSVHLMLRGRDPMWGAAAIEFGRAATPYSDWYRDHGGQEGKFILTRAAGGRFRL